MKLNSQICTTKEQSERLLTLGLKAETSDMYITNMSSKGINYTDDWKIGSIPYCNAISFLNSQGLQLEKTFWSIIPAWSLHRLKCLIPENTPCGYGYLTVEIINENVYIVLVIENVEQRVLKYTKGNLYDNLISCINFFVKESLFNKEYLE